MAMKMDKPADSPSRMLAVDPTQSILVQAPAGSGKTTLLTERFLTLLALVNDPGEIVAITFTKAAASEMRNRILDELEEAERESQGAGQRRHAATESAKQAWLHSESMGWKLLDQPAQLRITTIDSFCRQLALQRPLVSSLGGQLQVAEDCEDLYREAARRTLKQIGNGDAELRQALRVLLEWRDNNWPALEEELVRMLAVRDKWLQPFLFQDELSAQELREALEKPFVEAVRLQLGELQAQVEAHRTLIEQAVQLAAFADANLTQSKYAKIGSVPDALAALNDTTQAVQLGKILDAALELTDFLLVKGGQFRSRWTKSEGFPTTAKSQKTQIESLCKLLNTADGLGPALAGVRTLPTPRYTDEEWKVIRSCFAVLRRAAAHLNVVFAESGSVDYSDVARQALNIFASGQGEAAEAAFSVADGIRHLLVDEFQDTSRIQYKLLGSIIDQWPDVEGRSVFVVGDPMQSIYFFRNAEAELFHRSRNYGLDLPSGGNQPFRHAPLTANFRMQQELVGRMNELFTRITSAGSEGNFLPAQAARADNPTLAGESFQLHLGFMRNKSRSNSLNENLSITAEQRQLHRQQIDEIARLCQAYAPQIAAAKAEDGKFRIAILGRTKKNLVPIAAALQQAGISYRSLDLESLTDRPEVLDALALAKALLNPEDRISWLGVLRAPWCGLPLADLHLLVSADDESLLRAPIPRLIAERMNLVSADSQARLAHLLAAVEFAESSRAQNPSTAPGTWLESVWLQLGGSHTVTAAQRANLDLLWSTLDQLRDGEAGLLSPALDSALEGLKASPDPGSSTQYGIQLMTIHKAKGLEFEIVIVPELQSSTRKNNAEMLAWLERGTTVQDEQPTEFLVAARQPKGGERSSNKAWVDSVIRDREQDEIARLLYVACTRAREQLHLFARLCYRDISGELQLVDPGESLLKTAYPALEEQIVAAFDRFSNAKSTRSNPPAAADQLSLAASAAELIEFPSNNPESSTSLDLPLRRLNLEQLAKTVSSRSSSTAAIPVRAELYQRQRGGLESRLLGRAIHFMLESISRLNSPKEDPIPRLRPQILATLRADGLTIPEANALLRQAEAAILTTVSSPIGRWILAPHPSAATEPQWTGLVNGELRELRPDRLFLAGDAPLSQADASLAPVWWIIYYKSAHLATQYAAHELQDLRRLYSPQLELYGRFLRSLKGAAVSIRLGLFYPAADQLDHWPFTEL